MVWRWGERLATAADIDSLQAGYSDAAASLGFGAYSYVDLQRIPDETGPLPFFISTVREDFIRDYNAARFLSHDPVLRRAINSNTPFTWFDCGEYRQARRYRSGRKTKARQILELAQSYEFEDGLIIPAHSLDATGHRRSSFINLYWTEKPRAGFVGSQEMLALQFGSLLYHNRLVALRDATANDTLEEPANDLDTGLLLTDREGECLLWAAQGKTTEETAVIIGVSPHSVQSYLNTAMVKLGVEKKIQAVAKAIARGLITP
ncbi:MAG: LuxR family transcriptional regulator [Alphaproteobacteria bacterium]|nr:LuxR family transcriptional regulator [Alphaproteobacteria bacterium SS10]